MMKSLVSLEKCHIINLTENTVHIQGVAHPPHPEHASFCKWTYDRLDVAGFVSPAPFQGKLDLAINESLLDAAAPNTVILVDASIFCLLSLAAKHDTTLFQDRDTGMQRLVGVMAGAPSDEPRIVTSFDFVL
jgi:hypothetical protein